MPVSSVALGSDDLFDVAGVIAVKRNRNSSDLFSFPPKIVRIVCVAQVNQIYYSLYSQSSLKNGSLGWPMDRGWPGDWVTGRKKSQLNHTFRGIFGEMEEVEVEMN